MLNLDDNHVPVTGDCISLDAWTNSKKKFLYYEALRELMAPNAVNHEVATNYDRSFDIPSVYELHDIENSQYLERVFSVRDFKNRDFIRDVIDSTPRYDFYLNIFMIILQP